MKRKSIFKQVVFVSLVAVIVLACSGGALAATATATPAPTNTPQPTNTSTPKPTSTPMPTATEVAPTPTPAPMGTAVSNEDYEVNVVYMRTLQTVYLDAQYQWVPIAGHMFVELGIKIVNLKPGSTVSIRWGSVDITEKNGDLRYPNWGEFKPVANGVEVNPKKMVFRTLDNPDEMVTFDEVVYLRAIYGVKKMSPTTLLFGVEDSPLVEIVVP